MINKDFIKTRILIIGSNGLLGQRLTNFYSNLPNIELLCSSIEEKSFFSGIDYRQVDITKKSNVKELILDFFPDYIINCAAYTDVDRAESERQIAWKINVTGVENISLYAWTIDSHLIHISTDYIFDGKNGPYTEEDKPNPLGYYGRTKLAGENSIRSSGVRFTIIRTNVLYGPVQYGKPDFVKWAVNSLRENKTIRIVTDQINNPTYIDDIVTSINKIISFKKEGIYNIGGEEILSRYNFTIRIAEYFNFDKSLIKPIVTKDLNQTALRPLNSGLITLKAQTELGFKATPIDLTFKLMQKELNL